MNVITLGASDQPLMLGVVEYARHKGKGERTVRTWLAEGKLDGQAVKGPNGWMIPADAEPREPAGELEQLHAAVAALPQLPQFTGARLSEKLDELPVFIPLEQASRILGVSVYALKKNKEFFDLKPFGEDGSYVMPAGVIRKHAGI